jgi:hypothetical protein
MGLDAENVCRHFDCHCGSCFVGNFGWRPMPSPRQNLGAMQRTIFSNR